MSHRTQFDPQYLHCTRNQSFDLVDVLATVDNGMEHNCSFRMANVGDGNNRYFGKEVPAVFLGLRARGTTSAQERVAPEQPSWNVSGSGVLHGVSQLHAPRNRNQCSSSNITPCENDIVKYPGVWPCFSDAKNRRHKRDSFECELKLHQHLQHKKKLDLKFCSTALVSMDSRCSFDDFWNDNRSDHLVNNEKSPAFSSALRPLDAVGSRTTTLHPAQTEGVVSKEAPGHHFETHNERKNFLAPDGCSAGFRPKDQNQRHAGHIRSYPSPPSGRKRSNNSESNNVSIRQQKALMPRKRRNTDAHRSSAASNYEDGGNVVSSIFERKFSQHDTAYEYGVAIQQQMRYLGSTTMDMASWANQQGTKYRELLDGRASPVATQTIRFFNNGVEVDETGAPILPTDEGSRCKAHSTQDNARPRTSNLRDNDSVS